MFGLVLIFYTNSAKIEKEPFTLKLKSPLKARIDIVPFKLGLAHGHELNAFSLFS